MDKQISSQFRRALEQELRRQMEERPVFGQGGAAGGAVRRLDQELAQVNQRVKRLKADISKLSQKYWYITSQTTGAEWETPEAKKERRRIKKVAETLDETESVISQLEETLYQARNAKG